MSIQTELEALSTNLQAAKEAIAAKGGTTGDTGLAGLVEEIDTIPEGGGVEPPIASEFGVIHYWSVVNSEWAVQSSYNCTVSSVNQATFDAFMQSIGKTTLSLEYADWMGGWYYYGDDEEVTVDLSQIGISATIDDPEMGEASMHFLKSNIVDTTSPVLTSELSSLAETNFRTWATNHSTSPAAIKRFDCGWSTGAYPNNAIGAQVYSTNIRSDGSTQVEVDFTYFSGTSVGSYFLNFDINFLTPMSLSSLITVGESFMYFSSTQSSPVLGIDVRGLTTIPDSFMASRHIAVKPTTDTPLLLPDSVSTIGRRFFYQSGWVGTVKLPQNVTSIGTDFLGRFVNNGTDEMILDVGSVSPIGQVVYDGWNGLSSTNQSARLIIKGAARQAWLTAFPNGSSSGLYRTLVDGGE